jgi:hypothetical protein
MLHCTIAAACLHRGMGKEKFKRSKLEYVILFFLNTLSFEFWGVKMGDHVPFSRK